MANRRDMRQRVIALVEAGYGARSAGRLVGIPGSTAARRYGMFPPKHKIARNGSILKTGTFHWNTLYVKKMYLLLSLLPKSSPMTDQFLGDTGTRNGCSASITALSRSGLDVTRLWNKF
ncbi:hypothetical protein ANN_03312 [Periplaneta americana]|uniref:Uncharacterized protein n=1 Tax=Periplaneta americana TaxID=6978 RepID=A0ABQ8U2Q0_PERAM|nr:hypothetical protein ANN_03312 [Periplaneta americana]